MTTVEKLLDVSAKRIARIKWKKQPNIKLWEKKFKIEQWQDALMTNVTHRKGYQAMTNKSIRGLRKGLSEIEDALKSGRDPRAVIRRRIRHQKLYKKIRSKRPIGLDEIERWNQKFDNELFYQEYRDEIIAYNKARKDVISAGGDDIDIRSTNEAHALRQAKDDWEDKYGTRVLTQRSIIRLMEDD